MTLSLTRRLLAACTLFTPATALAASFTLGSGNTAVIEPPIAHPAENPCVVTLFANAVFGASNANYTYAPPAACPGPWAKVILTADIRLDAGIQYDRTGTIWMAGVPLWFGTTSEPTPTVAPHWVVQKDVTDDTSLFLAPQTGFALIANYTNSSDTSVITASAQLLFYPPTTKDPAPTVPDIVVPVSAPGGGTVALGSTSSVLAVPLSLPANVASARLDLYTQSQSGDEFWYTCVPNALAGQLDDCGGGAFREGEVAIDSTPAGVAPVYPWIYTGGIDPYLWSPMPGVQTLDFKPFPVDLTPFAGVLSSGAHTLNVSVYGANNYFSVAGALYVYLDHNTTTVTGGLLRDSLDAAPTPVTTTGTNANGVVSVRTSSARNFTISGYADTSAGRVVTTVHETTAFTNAQAFTLTNTLYDQQIRQDTETTVDETQKIAGGASSESVTTYSYPLTLSYVETVTASGGGRATTAINQEYHTDTIDSLNGIPVAQYDLLNVITPKDTLKFNSSFEITGNANQSSTELYATFGTGQPCFSRTLTAAANVLTSASTTKTCK